MKHNKTKISDDQLCKMIREAIADRPDLADPTNHLRLVRIEMLDGKPVHCYIESHENQQNKEI